MDEKMPEGVNKTEVDGKAHQRWNRHEEQGKTTDFKAKGRAFLLLFEEQCFNDAGRSNDHQGIKKDPHARGICTHDGRNIVRFGTMKLADAANDHAAASNALHGTSTEDA